MPFYAFFVPFWRFFMLFLPALLMNDLADKTGAEEEENGGDDEENEREIDVENEVDAVNLHVSPLHLDSFDSPNCQNLDPSVPSTSGTHSSMNLDHSYF